LPGPSRLRGFVKAEGQFDLPRGFRLVFDGQIISDEAYLRDYSLGNLDRIESRIAIERTRRDEYIGWRALHWRSLRSDEDNDTIPSMATVLTWRRNFTPALLGGRVDVELQTSGQLRSSNVNVIGRDVLRAGVRAEWERSEVLAGGLIATLGFGLRGDIYRTLQDPSFPEVHTALTPHAKAELRWPLRRVTANATEILEPVAQVIWVGSQPAGLVPNEDSTLVSFDEGNLFALGRFTGIDRIEGGTRLTLGLGWTRLGNDGTSLNLQGGRILRIDGLGQFSPQSGLAGRWSDWLVSASWDGRNGLGLQARSAFNDSFDFSRAELRTRLERSRYGLGSALLWAAADPLEGRISPTAEWLFDGRYAINDFWTLRTGTRLDISSGEVTYASGGLQFMNECLRLDLSLSRRFSSSGNVLPNTEFGLSFDLAGFGGSRSQGKARRSCG
jgi:LPS-assembly protein